MKQKTLESAFKFIRLKLMEGRTQSEARQDFDSKLTPIRWSDLRENLTSDSKSLAHQSCTRLRMIRRDNVSLLALSSPRSPFLTIATIFMMTTLTSMKTMTMMIHIQTSMLLL